MHRGHDHEHAPRIRGNGVPMAAGSRLGDNGAMPTQWQTPHLPPGATTKEGIAGESDLDLVEAAFVEGFITASDPTSFVRLAKVPFEMATPAGDRLALLRVEVDMLADVGSVMPHLGGTSFRYDPLPGQAVSRRRRLRFVYFDGKALQPLTLGEVRELTGA